MHQEGMGKWFLSYFPRGSSFLLQPTLDILGLAWWSRVKNLPSKAGDVGSIPTQGTKVPQVLG